MLCLSFCHLSHIVFSPYLASALDLSLYQFPYFLPSLTTFNTHFSHLHFLLISSQSISIPFYLSSLSLAPHYHFFLYISLPPSRSIPQFLLLSVYLPFLSHYIPHLLLWILIFPRWLLVVISNSLSTSLFWPFLSFLSYSTLFLPSICIFCSRSLSVILNLSCLL